MGQLATVSQYQLYFLKSMLLPQKETLRDTIDLIYAIKLAKFAK